MSYKTAKKFWINQKEYPKYPNLYKRRLIDVNFILNTINQPKSLLDIGCADGYLIRVLKELTDIKKFYAIDLSKKSIDFLIDNWKYDDVKLVANNGSILETFIYKADVILSMGLFPYIFEIKDLKLLLSRINTNLFIVRTPCTLNNEDEYINKYSKELKNTYSSIYRTIDNYNSIFKIFFKEVKIIKAYPNKIESKYGTKHFFFVCKNKLI